MTVGGGCGRASACVVWLFRQCRVIVPVVGMSQFMDDIKREPGVTMIDWINGNGTARYWALKLLRDACAPGDSFVQTDVTPAGEVKNICAAKLFWFSCSLVGSRMASKQSQIVPDSHRKICSTVPKNSPNLITGMSKQFFQQLSNTSGQLQIFAASVQDNFKTALSRLSGPSQDPIQYHIRQLQDHFTSKSYIRPLQD